MAVKNVLAFDYGASSGRAILGMFDGTGLDTTIVHRFSNDPVTAGGTMYWDVLRLFHEMKQGLLKTKAFGRIDSLGVDTWGVDFGLLDSYGKLIGSPVHYRDGRTKGMLEEAMKLLNRRRFYSVTGNQFMEINTAFQLLALLKKEPEILRRAETMLLMPDLFNYFLTGIRKTEYSIASTTQLTDAGRRTWSDEIITGLGLPKHIFPEIIQSGEILGPVTESLRTELGLSPCSVISVLSHDTESALVSVPAEEKDFIFLSCGTWSLMGTELDGPVISEESEKCNLTNEGAYGKETAFLKNIIGLWLIQESRRQWEKEGKEYSFADLEKTAEREKPFRCFIDPDAPEFTAAGNIPERIREFCRKTGQEIPDTEGQIVRCIDESLALKYRCALDEIRSCTGKDFRKIYIVGGGTQSAMLCQMTADACGMPVSAGPVEATVYGNMAMQLIAEKEMKSVSEFRAMIAATEMPAQYEPACHAEWQEAYGRFLKICRG
jgi:rhamnulokinase